jgi:predicted Zn-dependent protease with MMP-like domain
VYLSLVKDYPDDAWAHHTLGLLAERRGEDPQPHFKKAQALAPDEFPPPVHLGAAEFDAAVAEAIASLPEHAKPHLANCVIDVQPIPSDDDLKEGGISPLILGVFRGQAIDERSPVDAAHHETARITLYQHNLERFARSREELLEEIRITVLHEVGHLLGLDEDELYERGLD